MIQRVRNKRTGKIMEGVYLGVTDVKNNGRNSRKVLFYDFNTGSHYYRSFARFKKDWEFI